MVFFASYFSDVGTCRQVNQDSLALIKASCNGQQFIFAVVCDGMGGAEEGEVSSKAGVEAFSYWFENRFPQLFKNRKKEKLFDLCIADWKKLIIEVNRRLCDYGTGHSIKTGTTLSAILITGTGEYALAHVGDSRIYEIRGGVRCLTEDQSLVAEEARNGLISWESINTDPRRNVLLECIGVSEKINPQFATGRFTRKNTAVVLCSDGFYHEQKDRELEELGRKIQSEGEIRERLRAMVWNAENRGETDNITAICICMA